jgi:ATP-dependent DNA ligase
MREAAFIPPMLLLRTHTLPEGPQWRYELKHDGYRAVAFKSGGRLFLRSRNNKDFADSYPEILEGLAKLQHNTVIDGEVVALDGSGRPSFNALQNSASSARELVYYIYVLILSGKDVMAEPFDQRRTLLEKKILPKLAEPLRYSLTLNAELAVLIESVKASGLEGLVAKRADSRYEPGIRSGAWQKMRINQGQEFVIGGYTEGGATFDALVLREAQESAGSNARRVSAPTTGPFLMPKNTAIARMTEIHSSSGAIIRPGSMARWG